MMMLRAYASRDSHGLNYYTSYNAALPIHHLTPARPLNVQYTQPVRSVQQRPAPLIQQQTDSILDNIIKLAAEIGWEVFKAKWAQVSPDSRKAWDLGAKLATSSSVAPVGQKIGAGLCVASLIVGLNDMDEAALHKYSEVVA